MYQLIPRKSNCIHDSLIKICENWKFLHNKFYIKVFMNKEDSDISFITPIISYHSIFNGDLA
jgi:hypothetical protein